VDVNLYQYENGWRALHLAVGMGAVACTRLLIDAGADLEVRDGTGLTPANLACVLGNSDCLQVLIEHKADVNTANDQAFTPLYHATIGDHPNCIKLIIDAGADVNVKVANGYTPAVAACRFDRLACLQLLVDKKVDLNMKSDAGNATLYPAILFPPGEEAPRVPGMPFAVLSCNTDSVTVPITDAVTRAMVETHIDEYKQIQAFVDEYHNVAKRALYNDVVVDKRVGLCDNGLYHEPLEQVLFYLGLSMDKNQTVNKSIDGETAAIRAMVPGHPTNANLWYQLYQRTH
jgi:hypothetical protein